MRIFITGIGGALGAKLALALKKMGFEITGNDIKPLQDVEQKGLKDFNYLWKATEDLSINELTGMDIIVNLSATADRPMGISSPLHTTYNNLLPTIRLLEISKEINLTKFIQLGSGTIYLGISKKKLPATEATIPKPTNPYSASKYAQDIICQSYHRAYNIPLVILRSGMTYGEGRLAIAPHKFMIQALQNQPIIVNGGQQTRTPTHINDVIKYCVGAIEAPSEICNGEVIHAVYPTSKDVKGEYSLLEMAKLVKKVTISKSKIEIHDYEIGEYLRNSGPVREWIISTRATEIGVSPEIDFQTGLELTKKWLESKYKNYLDLG